MIVATLKVTQQWRDFGESFSDTPTSFIKPAVVEIRPTEGEITPYRDLERN